MHMSWKFNGLFTMRWQDPFTCVVFRGYYFLFVFLFTQLVKMIDCQSEHE